MTIEDLFKEFLQTLDDKRHDEEYMSDRSFASIGLYDFLEWLKTTDYKIIVTK